MKDPKNKTYDPTFVNPDIRKKFGEERLNDDMEAPEMAIPNPGKGFESVPTPSAGAPDTSDPGEPITGKGWNANRPRAGSKARE